MKYRTYAIPFRDNFKHFLRAVPARSALFEKWNAFFFTKNSKNTCHLEEGISVLIALNLEKREERILNWALLRDFFLFAG